MRAAGECVRGRGVAVVGEFGEITGGHDAKPADLGQGVQLGVAQLVGLVAIHVARAAGSSEDQLDPLLAGWRRAFVASGSSRFPGPADRPVPPPREFFPAS